MNLKIAPDDPLVAQEAACHMEFQLVAEITAEGHTLEAKKETCSPKISTPTTLPSLTSNLLNEENLICHK